MSGASSRATWPGSRIGGQPGPDVDNLSDARLVDGEPDRAAQEVPVRPGCCLRVGHHGEQVLRETPVFFIVVLTAEQVIVNAADVGPARPAVTDHRTVLRGIAADDTGRGEPVGGRQVTAGLRAARTLSMTSGSSVAHLDVPHRTGTANFGPRAPGTRAGSDRPGGTGIVRLHVADLRRSTGHRSGSLSSPVVPEASCWQRPSVVLVQQSSRTRVIHGYGTAPLGVHG